MDNYIEITLKPDAEMPVNRLLNSIYTKLHKALYELSSRNIGVSFPHYQVTLGNVMRLHGSSRELDKLQSTDWLGGMKGYCRVGEMLLVPADCQYRTVGRKQTTMSHAKLERLLKRGSITQEEAKQYKAKMFTKGLDNPYVELVSASNGHKHRRYIQFGELTNEPVEGEFDQFGLSKQATIPWFD